MAVIEFSKEFFAKVMLAQESSLHFCVLSRIYDDPSIKTYTVPAIRVEGVEQSRYAIFDARFVPLGRLSDSKVISEDATVYQDEKGWAFRAKSGAKARLTKQNLYDIYADRVVNPLLK